MNISPTAMLNPAPSGRLPDGFLPRKCTFTPNDWAILAKQWFPVACSVDVQLKPLAVTLLDLELVVYRTPAGIFVGRDLCPHRGVPLSMVVWTERNWCVPIMVCVMVRTVSAA